MGLNITAERRVDLSDYGNGWDGCYLTVKAMNPKELDAWYVAMNADEMKDVSLSDIYGDLLKKQLVGGVILNTNPDGSKEPYTITPADINIVVDSIDLNHKQSALFIAAGNQGLKDR